MREITVGSYLYEVQVPEIVVGATGRKWVQGDKLGLRDLPDELLDRYLEEGIVKRMRLKRVQKDEEDDKQG